MYTSRLQQDRPLTEFCCRLPSCHVVLKAVFGVFASWRNLAIWMEDAISDLVPKRQNTNCGKMSVSYYKDTMPIYPSLHPVHIHTMGKHSVYTPNVSTPCPYTMSIHPVHTQCLYTMSIHDVNATFPNTLSIHNVHTPCLYPPYPCTILMYPFISLHLSIDPVPIPCLYTPYPYTTSIHSVYT